MMKQQKSLLGNFGFVTLIALNVMIFIFVCRLVNMVSLFQSDLKMMWKHVRNAIISNKLKVEFYYNNPLLETDIIKKNNDLLEIELGIEEDYSTRENVTMEILQKSAEIFFYMNLCSEYRSVLKDIFESHSSKNIIFALQSIKEKSFNSNKQLLDKIWSFVTKKLNLNTHDKLKYVLDQKFSLRGTINESLQNFTLALSKEG